MSCLHLSAGPSREWGSVEAAAPVPTLPASTDWGGLHSEGFLLPLLPGPAWLPSPALPLAAVSCRGEEVVMQRPPLHSFPSCFGWVWGGVGSIWWGPLLSPPPCPPADSWRGQSWEQKAHLARQQGRGEAPATKSPTAVLDESVGAGAAWWGSLLPRFAAVAFWQGRGAGGRFCAGFSPPCS